MKRILIALCAFLTVATTNSFAADGISPIVLKSFLSTFNDARDISWNESYGYMVASFVQNGIKRSAYYDQVGILVVVGKQIETQALPQSFKTNLEQSFAGYSLVYLYEMQDENGLSYYATITNGKKEKVVRTNGKKWKCLRTKKS